MRRYVSWFKSVRKAISKSVQADDERPQGITCRPATQRVNQVHFLNERKARVFERVRMPTDCFEKMVKLRLNKEVPFEHQELKVNERWQESAEALVLTLVDGQRYSRHLCN